MAGDEKGDKVADKIPFWKNSSGSRSQHILLGFVTAIIIMLIVTLTMGAYGYISWQEWKKGPGIRVSDGLFEFHDDNTTGYANITVHITLINSGQKTSDELTLEWLIMDSNQSHDNIIVTRGYMEVPPMDPDTSRDERFDITLSMGEYMIAYRVYDGELFSYEARQDIIVGYDDVDHGAPEDVTIPEFRSAIIPVISVIILFFIFRRRYHG